MIDERVIEELREYLKDHYTPSHDSIETNYVSFPTTGILTGVSLNNANTVFGKAVSLRNISGFIKRIINRKNKNVCRQTFR